MSVIKKLYMEKGRINRMSYKDFECYIFSILNESNQFDTIYHLTDLKDLGIDLVAENENECLLIYIKKSKLIGNDYIMLLAEISRKIEKYNNKAAKIVLITSGDFTEGAKLVAEELNIELWDYRALFEIKEFGKNYSEVTVIKIEKTPADEFKERLSTIVCGRSEWSSYQKCVADIFEFLFYPTLDTPRFEMSDYDKANRRDIIMENQSEKGFWKNIRDLYKGDYIVIDAKNYSSKIRKQPVIDLAYYLKPYGCGMFGIIVCRKGSEKSAFHATKEQWIASNKLIICLNDQDIIEMLEIKKNNGTPEEIIKRKIADFRMRL